MKIWAISDTHMQHWGLKVPDVDMVVHSGDASNKKNPAINTNEYLDFLEWWCNLPIKYKVLVAGNHDTSIQTRKIDLKKLSEEKGFIYLEHEHIVVENIKIFGSPYTPTFGTDWAFNIKRDKLDNYWKVIEEDTDIVITHGPPRGVLDLTWGKISDLMWNERLYKQCGCSPLLKHMHRVKPKYHIFGHIHAEDRCPNAGTMKINGLDTTFVNASVVPLKEYRLINNGVILEI